MDAAQDDIERAAALLREGGVVAFPTETVYGLGASALDPRAIARVFEIKRRPSFDPLIVHIEDPAWLPRIARDVPEGARRLMRAFWPGPLTVVLPKTDLVPDVATAGLETVAVRMPSHEVARAILRRAAIPVCAPSANPFGYVSPTRAEHVREQLGHLVDLIVDGGPCSVGVESTIVGFGPDGARLLRPGGVPAEAVSEALGEPLLEGPGGEGVSAPGMLPRHYAPSAFVRLFDGEIPAPPSPASGLLLQREREAPPGYAAVETLSRGGDPAEAAANLFAAIRRLDGLRLDAIVAELATEEGLGRAINDRLRRASFRGRVPG